MPSWRKQGQRDLRRHSEKSVTMEIVKERLVQKYKD